MANTDRPMGAVESGSLSGAGVTGKVREYDVDASNGTAIFRGDFIKLEADGKVAPATAGDRILGVCVGVKVDLAEAATEHPGYLAASTAGTIFVNIDPHALYEVQEDSAVSDLALTDIGALVDIVAGAGSTTTGRSAHELDSDSVGTANGQLKIIDLIDRADNAVGTNAKWLVQINESSFTTEAGV